MIGTYGDNDRPTPDRIKHGLDDKQAYLWIHNYRLATSVTASDDELHADLILADKLASESAMFLREIQGLLDKRAADAAAAANEAHEQHAAEPVDVAIIHLTEAEYEAAVANDLARLGCTYEQLVEMARTGDYATPDHRLLWLHIKPLDDVLVAGDALADLPEPPAVPVAGEHEVIYIDASDLGDKEAAFERFVETTAAEHKRAREAGEDR